MAARASTIASAGTPIVLDAYIIEEIKKREEERRRREDASRPRLHIEVPERPPRRPDAGEGDGERERERDDEEPDERDRGIIRIDLLGDGA